MIISFSNKYYFILKKNNKKKYLYLGCLLVIMLSICFVTLEVYNIFDKDIPCMSGDTSDFSNRVKGYKRLYNFMPKLINYLLMIFLFSYSTAIQTTF